MEPMVPTQRDDDETQDDGPLDDRADFVVSRRQAMIRRNKDSKRRMEKEAEKIWGSLREYASHMSYVEEP